MTALVPLTVPSERGTVAGPVTARGSDFADLMRQVKAAGLLERRRGYYWAKIAVTGGLLAAGWAVFVVLGDSWWQLVVAAFLAVVFTHLFPSVPRPNLRRCQAIVKAFCHQHGVSYCETTLWRSYAQATRHLHDVGRPLRHRGLTRPAAHVPGRAARQRAVVMFTHTNTNAVRSVATRGVQHTPLHSGTPAPWLSEPTDGMPHQLFIDSAGTILPGPARVEGSIR